MHVVELVGVTTLRSCVACHLQWCLHLDNSAANVVGLLLGLVMVTMQGALIGLTAGLPVGTLGIGACGFILICLVVTGMGYGNACWCLHPRNSLRVANIVWGNGFFKLVGICLYANQC